MALSGRFKTVRSHGSRYPFEGARSDCIDGKQGESCRPSVRGSSTPSTNESDGRIQDLYADMADRCLGSLPSQIERNTIRGKSMRRSHFQREQLNPNGQMDPAVAVAPAVQDHYDSNASRRTSLQSSQCSSAPYDAPQEPHGSFRPDDCDSLMSSQPGVGLAGPPQEVAHKPARGTEAALGVGRCSVPEQGLSCTLLATRFYHLLDELRSDYDRNASELRTARCELEALRRQFLRPEFDAATAPHARCRSPSWPSMPRQALEVVDVTPSEEMLQRWPRQMPDMRPGRSSSGFPMSSRSRSQRTADFARQALPPISAPLAAIDGKVLAVAAVDTPAPQLVPSAEARNDDPDLNSAPCLGSGLAASARGGSEQGCCVNALECESSKEERNTSVQLHGEELACEQPIVRKGWQKATHKMAQATDAAVESVKQTEFFKIMTNRCSVSLDLGSQSSFECQKGRTLDEKVATRQITDPPAFCHDPRFHIRRIVKSAPFEFFFFMAIISNGAVIGYEVEMNATRRKGYDDIHLRRTHIVFSALFLLELIMRIAADGLRFFTNDDWRWNLFDLVLVSHSCVDFVMEYVYEEEDVLGGGALSRQRSLRVLRIVRNFRIVRMLRIFQELRLMLFAILGCFKALIWLIFLLVLLLYFFAVFFTQGATDYEDQHPDEEFGKLDEHYGSLFLSMFSLYKGMTGGVNWGELVTPLAELHWFYVLLILGFISFAIFAVLNVVTSVFVDSALVQSQEEMEARHREAKKVEAYELRRLECMFTQIDTDASGYITIAEFTEGLCDAHVQTCFRMLGIHADEAEQLFLLLDVDEVGEVAIEDFVKGCRRLKGEAKSLDIGCLMLGQRRIMAKISSLTDSIMEQFLLITGPRSSSASAVWSLPPPIDAAQRE